MRAQYVTTLTLSVLAVIAPSVAGAEQVRLTDVAVEQTENEVRAIVTLDPPTPAPPHRFMRDDQALRLRFLDVDGEELERAVTDETLRRVRVLSSHGRLVVRIDPRAASASDLFERAEVQPHPRGLVVVIRRSEAEAAARRAALAPRERPAPAEAVEAAEAAPAAAGADQADDRAGPEAEAPAAASAEPGEDAAPAAAPARSGGQRSTSRRTPAAAALSPWRASTAVIVLIMIAAGALMLYRRRKVQAVGVGRSINVLAARRIGTRQSLLLVEAGGQTLLVGVTERGMTRLATLPPQGEHGEVENDDEDLADRFAPRGHGDDAFSHVLHSAASSPPPPRNHGSGAWSMAGLTAAAQGRRASSAPERGDDEQANPIEGLLQLRRTASSPPQGMPRPQLDKMNGKRNGKELSLDALESLLASRAATTS